MSDKKVPAFWKTLAIGLIIILTCETVFFLGLLWVGTSDINKENECSVACADFGATSYQYNSGTCACYDSENNIIKQEFIR